MNKGGLYNFTLLCRINKKSFGRKVENYLGYLVMVSKVCSSKIEDVSVGINEIHPP